MNTRLTFLGTGTSTGVPQINCHCPVCTSTDPLDKRLRCSALLETAGRKLLLDCSPDFRQQVLRHPIDHLDAVLLTHIHYDHVGGIDDLRYFCHHYGEKGHLPIYCAEDVSDDLHARLPYCFKLHPYPGVPTFDIRLIKPDETFSIDKLITVKPLLVYHWKLPIVGYRIGRLAYITDCKTLPEQTVQELKGIDTLVLNALRIEEHNSHLSLGQALALIDMIKPGRTFLTHMSHQIGCHADVQSTLPPNVFLAYDGLQITV